MSLDPLFGTSSYISRNSPVVNPAPQASDDEAAEYADRAEVIWAAAQRVRTALFESYEAVMGESAEMLPLTDQTKLLLGAFCRREHSLAPYKTAALDEALGDFNKLVPTIRFNAFEKLTQFSPSVTADDPKRLLRQHAEGRLNEKDLEQAARALASRAMIEYPEGEDPKSAVQIIQGAIDKLPRGTPVLKEIADSSESRVYLNETNNVVYKAVPFRGELLHVKPVLGEENIEVDRSSGSYLADAHNSMPLFDRARLLAQVPGVCRTELVAISSEGLAIYKQPFLGWEEPSEQAIAEWSQQFCLPTIPQEVNDSDPVLADANRLPFVAPSPTEGKYVIGADLNPRNCRMWNGQCVPFDPVLRELDVEEISNHSKIAAAVETIARNRNRYVDAPDI